MITLTFLFNETEFVYIEVILCYTKTSWTNSIVKSGSFCLPFAWVHAILFIRLTEFLSEIHFENFRNFSAMKWTINLLHHSINFLLIWLLKTSFYISPLLRSWTRFSRKCFRTQPHTDLLVNSNDRCYGEIQMKIPCKIHQIQG